jgi:DNA gyrase subunit A
MKFEGEDADDRMIAAAVCAPEDDILLATRGGRSIRFAVEDVRVFSSRNSVGVRGVKLLKDDRVISLSILNHVEVSPDIRNAYLSESSRRRRAPGEEVEIETPDDEEGEATAASISEEEFNDLKGREQFLLSITEKGFGVRSSSYDYRITGRGGQGIVNMKLAKRQDAMVGVFPVATRDQIILVTDGGMMIRVPIEGIRLARRGSSGVVVFKVGDAERVVSVAHLGDSDEPSDPEGGAEPPIAGEDS